VPIPRLELVLRGFWEARDYTNTNLFIGLYRYYYYCRGSIHTTLMVTLLYWLHTTRSDSLLVHRSCTLVRALLLLLPIGAATWKLNGTLTRRVERTRCVASVQWMGPRKTCWRNDGWREREAFVAISGHWPCYLHPSCPSFSVTRSDFLHVCGGLDDVGHSFSIPI
jgi:hypothetical protein